jgi:cation diffusion facilitator family transporter
MTRRLTRLMLLSVAAAVATIGLKAAAWLLTGSVGFLSDAAESLVNLVGAIVALIAIRVAARPPDDDHAYGHEKAEYFSAGAEGAMILVAAVGIAWVAVGRLMDPEPLSAVGVGVGVSAAATVLNLVVAALLLRVGREQRSITLEADGRHLMTDVWTSIGVIAGIIGVALTGWDRLDPIIALLVSLNILRTGAQLLRRSAGGLMDHALGPAEQAEIKAVLDSYREDRAEFHALRTRQAGRRAFVSVHILVPGAWTVQQGHDLAERVEDDVRERLPYATAFTHVDPRRTPPRSRMFGSIAPPDSPSFTSLKHLIE